MWGRSLGVAVAMAMVLGGGLKADAEIYLWTDEQGVVHMTNQWSNVPESARARVLVRDTTPPLNDDTPALEPMALPFESVPVRPSPMQMPPDLALTSPSGGLLRPLVCRIQMIRHCCFRGRDHTFISLTRFRRRFPTTYGLIPSTRISSGWVGIESPRIPLHILVSRSMHRRNSATVYGL